RERFEYCLEGWREIRDQARIDMYYVVGDPWGSTPELQADCTARKSNGRPALSLDELSQYINQRIGDVRQNKRAVKVGPGDNLEGGNPEEDEKISDLHGDIIRTIEYRSQAQAAYTTAFENALQRSYGYFRVGKRHVSEDSFDQELYVGPIPNPDTVYLDPDFKKRDASDMQYAFLIEDISKESFKRRWPSAEELSFPDELMTQFPHWIKPKHIQIAEYWAVQSKSATLVYYGSEQEPMKGFLGEGDLEGAKIHGKNLVVLRNGTMIPLLRQRKSEIRSIIQRITNGVEILEETEWEGKWIPIIPVFGKEIWLDKGTGAKRVLESLIRKAREGVMLHNYYASTEMEIVGQIPKTPWLGYEGQFVGLEEDWANANKVPIPYLQARATLPDVLGDTPLPLPTRNMWEPPTQALMLGKEHAKRAIQNSMGMYNASVGRQDSSAKSGVAIKALDLQSDQGNYHFLDNYDTALEHCGRILDDMIPHVYDTQRSMAIQKPDDTQSVIRLNQKYQDPKTGEQKEFTPKHANRNITISTGPSFQSQREEAGAFADAIAQQPAIFQRIGDLVIKLKQLGPLGDQMAERLKPPDVSAAEKDNPQAMAQNLQKAMQMVEAMTQQLNQLTEERNAKTQELQSKERIAMAEIQSKENIAALNAQLESARIASDENLAMMKAEMEAIKTQIAALRQPENMEMRPI
ncbi:MAG: portal protein, partial [Acidobacteriota bacterium]